MGNITRFSFCQREYYTLRNRVNSWLGIHLPFFFEILVSGNGSFAKNLDMTGVLFTLSLSLLILNSQCKKGVNDVPVH